MQHYDLDPAGDLTLVIGAKFETSRHDTSASDVENDSLDELSGCTLLVCRRIVSQASPVWRATLTRSVWQESATSRIPLPDDDPEAMLVLLQIAHLHFHLVPEQVDRRTLYNLAILCDKYDCVELTRP
jgi:hypothetical protein